MQHEQYKAIRLFEKLRIKKTKPLTSLTFLLRCRYHNTIPRFLQFHHHIHSPAANRIYQRTSFAPLRERIHQIRRELDNTSRDLLEIHLRLAIVLSKSDWSLIDQLTFKKATRVGEDSKARQLWKFASLHKTKHPTTKTSNSHGSTRHNIPLQRPQMKLSSTSVGRSWTTEFSSLPRRGFNYAVTPRSISIEGILAGVEKAVKFLPVEMAEEASQETMRIIKSSSRPRENLTRTERTVLKTLKKNTNLTILPADKGNATEILNTIDYKQKITSHFEDPS